MPNIIILKGKFRINKKYYDQHKIPVRNNTFSYHFEGSYTIIKNISDNTYLVEVTKNGQFTQDYRHVSQLKKFKLQNM